MLCTPSKQVSLGVNREIGRAGLSWSYTNQSRVGCRDQQNYARLIASVMIGNQHEVKLYYHRNPIDLKGCTWTQNGKVRRTSSTRSEQNSELNCRMNEFGQKASSWPWILRILALIVQLQQLRCSVWLQSLSRIPAQRRINVRRTDLQWFWAAMWTTHTRLLHEVLLKQANIDPRTLKILIQSVSLVRLPHLCHSMTREEKASTHLHPLSSPTSVEWSKSKSTLPS